MATEPSLLQTGCWPFPTIPYLPMPALVLGNVSPPAASSTRQEQREARQRRTRKQAIVSPAKPQEPSGTPAHAQLPNKQIRLLWLVGKRHSSLAHDRRANASL